MHGVLLPELEWESPEWYEARSHTLGASEISAALGLSPWQSAYSLWAEKTGRLGHPEASQAMRLGTFLEAPILDWFQSESGLYAIERGQSWAHPDESWMTASPDALAVESGAYALLEDDEEAEVLGIVEAKTDFNVWHPYGEEPDGSHVPDHYQLQAHWQMWVMGLDRAWIPLLATGTRRFQVYPLERNEDLIGVVVEAARSFWEYVTTDTPPPVDEHEATSKALSEVHRDPDDVDVELDREAADALVELRQVKKRIKEIEKRKSYLENVVKAAIGDATVGTIAGAEAVTWKPQSDKRRFDQEGFEGEYPFMVKRFTKERTETYLDTKQIKEGEPDLFRQFDAPIRVLRVKG